MHICYLCNEYPPAKHGGIGSFVQTLGREFVRRGHAVTVLGVYPQPGPSEETDEGVRVLRLPEGAVPAVRLLLRRRALNSKLRSLHRENPIDVIEGSERSFFLIERSLAIPKIVRMHGGYCYLSVMLGQKPGRWLSFVERTSFATADSVAAVSRFVGETTRGLVGLGTRPIRVILNPVDLNIFRPPDPPCEQEDHLVCVGTVIERKGVRQLIEAMPKILEARPRARLTFYGNDSRHPDTGESYTRFLERNLPEALRPHVSFAGPVPRLRLPEVMAPASVCLYPSHIESLPIAWLEGMAMGKAVVASDVGPGPEVVEHEVSGLLCNPRDPDAIAQAVIRLLQDAELRRRLGAAARLRTEKLFALDKLIDENLGYYRECAAAFQGRLP